MNDAEPHCAPWGCSSVSAVLDCAQSMAMMLVLGQVREDPIPVVPAACLQADVVVALEGLGAPQWADTRQ